MSDVIVREKAAADKRELNWQAGGSQGIRVKSIGLDRFHGPQSKCVWPASSVFSILERFTTVMNRGDHRERIFDDDHDRQQFLDTLGEVCTKTNWLCH